MIDVELDAMEDSEDIHVTTNDVDEALLAIIGFPYHLMSEKPYATLLQTAAIKAFMHGLDNDATRVIRHAMFALDADGNLPLPEVF